MKYSISLFALLVLFLASCQKEQPITVEEETNPVALVADQIDMGSDYRYQIFYDLQDGAVSQNLKNNWDLGFESSESGWHILLNSARTRGVYATGSTDISVNVVPEEITEWSVDAPNGDLNQTAIGDYRNSGEVFLVDRGYDELGEHTGYRKLIIQSSDEDSYTLTIAGLDGTGPETITIQKDSQVHFTAFSFDGNQAVTVEPAKDEWDFVFTQYTHVFIDPPMSYMVTGVLINWDVEVAIDTENAFEEISADDISDYEFSSDRNIIGYDWKFFDFESNTFVVDPSINYIIKDTSGKYYKLHFIDFYNDSGEKGSPSFEIEAL